MTSRQFVMTNGFANQFLIPLLATKAGKRLGRRLAVVEYLGRRTGKRHQLVTQYTLNGMTVRISVGMAERKTWWRNFEELHPIRLRLAGVTHDTSARTMRDGNQVSVIAELRPENQSAPRPECSQPGGLI
jgi:hypothetical protein